MPINESIYVLSPVFFSHPDLQLWNQESVSDLEVGHLNSGWIAHLCTKVEPSAISSPIGDIRCNPYLGS